ncbi:MAG: hypothetical protein O2992_14420 [Gemmatimonadetes bacterium]|jgi:hypothetical protein|nr:hypothetical protein [Gemmatimonadota bacterium]
MSKNPLTLILAVGLLAMPKPAMGQHVARIEAELLNYFDSMAPRLAAVLAARQIAARDRAEALRASNASTTDTISVGLLTVVARSDQAELARTLYASVWRDYEAFVDQSRALETAYFTFQWASNQLGSVVEDRPVYRVEHKGFTTRAGIESSIREQIGKALSADANLEHPLTGWQSPLPLLVNASVRETEVLTWLYRQVATTPALAARKCMEADAGACWDLLALAQGGGSGALKRTATSCCRTAGGAPAEAKKLGSLI